MSNSPNYDKLPVWLRVYQEQLFFNDRETDKTLVISPHDKINNREHYYHSLRILNDRLAAEVNKTGLDTIREELAQNFAAEPTKFRPFMDVLGATPTDPPSQLTVEIEGAERK